MIRFAGITEIFRLIFRQCSPTSRRMVRMDIYLVADVLDQSVSIWASSVTWRRRLQPFIIFLTPSALVHMKLGSVHSGNPRSLIAFTLSASVEGGCKRIGRIPGVMRSHSH